MLFRTMGYFRDGGVGAMHNLLRRRFNNRWDEHETRLIAEYLGQITAQPPSGEFAMNSLLQPILAADGHAGVYARRPVGKLPRDVPVSVLFGDNDWLRPHNSGAERFVAAANGAGVQATLGTTDRAGHHLYMDNSESFNRVVTQLHV